MSVESIVRPNQKTDRFSVDRLSTNPYGRPGKASLSWGKVGKKKIPKPVGTDVELNDCGETAGELKSRETEDVRMENPDDPGQYVVVRRPKVILYKHTEKKESSWEKMSLVAASVAQWQSEMDALFAPYQEEDKCKLKMTLKAPTPASGAQDLETN